MFISLFLNSNYVSSERRSFSIQKSFFSFFLHPTSFLAKSTSLPSRFLLVRINEFAVKVEKKTNHKTEFHLLRLRVIFSVIEGLIKITDIEGRKRLDFYANNNRIAREMQRIEKYTKDQTFVINQILEKSVFFFSHFPCFLEKDLWRGRMCHPPWKRKSLRHVYVRVIRTDRVERIFFTFQNRYFPPRRMERVQTFNFNTKSLLFDRRSMKGEKKKIGEIYDYSFARKENRFRLIRCFALRMFYISFDKIL